ncbi:MAG TPA: hypothetical protein VJK54_09730 [Chthoniobacterales bacterium]|nr:hypothetical protein [Chthoniobacterales bacterium]
MSATEVVQGRRLLIHPILFKKWTYVAWSIKWSRNAFIREFLIYTLNMVRDEEINPIPMVVVMDRVVILSVKFETNETKSLKIS